MRARTLRRERDRLRDASSGTGLRDRRNSRLEVPPPALHRPRTSPTSPASTPKLIVELDGGQHAEQRARTTRRATRSCEPQGFRVLRFWNNDVLNAGVMLVMEQILAMAAADPHPSPLPQAGEGARHQGAIVMKQIQDAYIVAATRTPIGRSHRGFFRNTRPDDLLATTLQGRARAGARARPEGHRGHHLRLRDSRGAAGPQRRAHRRRAGGPAQQRRRHHRQPLLRLRPVGRADGGRPHPRRRGRRDDRRRRREHEHGADDGQLALAVALDLRARRLESTASPTAWASPPRRWRSSGRSAARRRTSSRCSRTSARWPRSRPASSPTRSRRSK